MPGSIIPGTSGFERVLMFPRWNLLRISSFEFDRFNTDRLLIYDSLPTQSRSPSFPSLPSVNEGARSCRNAALANRGGSGYPVLFAADSTGSSASEVSLGRRRFERPEPRRLLFFRKAIRCEPVKRSPGCGPAGRCGCARWGISFRRTSGTRPISGTTASGSTLSTGR